MADRFEIDIRIERGPFRLEASMRSHHASIGVSGPSGSGKSTLLRALAGLERRVDGRIVMSGTPWLDSSRGHILAPWERGVGWVPQDSLLFPHMDVTENLRFGVDAAPSEVARIGELLSISHLLHRRPRNLSGGERQRVALGRALLTGARTLLMDEPLSALDRTLRTEVTERIREYLMESGRLFILVSHDSDDLEALVDERWEVVEGLVRRVGAEGSEAVSAPIAGVPVPDPPTRPDGDDAAS